MFMWNRFIATSVRRTYFVSHDIQIMKTMHNLFCINDNNCSKHDNENNNYKHNKSRLFDIIINIRKPIFDTCILACLHSKICDSRIQDICENFDYHILELGIVSRF